MRVRMDNANQPGTKADLAALEDWVGEHSEDSVRALRPTHFR